MKLVKVRKRVPQNIWGCPLTKNRSPWCHAWCTPHHGLGVCGRIAPHGLRGRTQRAITAFKDQQD